MRPTFVSRLAASGGLSVLFLVVYSGCNWITAQRHDVGTIYSEWERMIPFVPLMIVPYMSIDLFFVTAPFLCGDRRELATFAKRVAAAIIVAGICFLLFPLRFAFERPHTGGILGAIFDWFRGMDLPYNLCPSLHITLSVLLGATFARHLGGVLRSVVGIWFVLIRASAVLTYQHHVMDVVGGFALAGYCFYFIRETPVFSPVTPNRAIGLRYLAGAVVLVAAAVGFWSWSGFLLWPALSLGIVATAYFGAGPVIFRKVDGLVPWSTWWALGPCLLGQYLSRLYYMRQCRAWDQVTPQVWIGRVLDKAEAAQAIEAGVTAVLDLTAEFSEPEVFRNVHYRNVPILDLTAPTPNQINEIVRFIDQQSKPGVVYVHCKIGYSRSAAAVIAWLLATGKVDSVAEGIAWLRRVRPSIVIRPEIQAALTEFESRRSVAA